MDNLDIDYKKAAQQLHSGEALFGKDGMYNQWCSVNRYRIFVSKKFLILYMPISCL